MSALGRDADSPTDDEIKQAAEYLDAADMPDRENPCKEVIEQVMAAWAGLINGGILKLNNGSYTFGCPKCAKVFFFESKPEGKCPDCG